MVCHRFWPRNGTRDGKPPVKRYRFRGEYIHAPITTPNSAPAVPTIAAHVVNLIQNG